MQHCCIYFCNIVAFIYLCSELKKVPHILLIILTSYTTCWSQEYCDVNISGHVISKEDKSTLPGAVITLGTSTTIGTSTDYFGKFILKKVCITQPYVIIKFLSYKTDTVSFDVINQKNIHLEISLDSENTLLEEVHITGQRAKISRNQSLTRLSRKDIERSAGKSIGEILKGATGVNALQTGPTIFKPVIHGLHSQRIQIINNGVRLEGQQWGAEHGPEIDPYIASEIIVVKGADVVRYGADAIGGAIIINPPSIHNAEEFGGEMYMLGATNGRLGAFSGMLEGRLLKEHHWKWRIQGTAKRAGDFHTPDYQLTNTGVKELNFSGAVGYRDRVKSLEFFISSYNTELGILKAAHTGSMTDLEQAINLHQAGGTPLIADNFSYKIDNPRQEVNHHLAEIRASHDFEHLGKMELTYSGQLNKRKEYDIRKARNTDRPALDMELLAHNIDLSLSHRKQGSFQGVVGVSVSLKDNRNVPGTGVIPLIPDYEQRTIGGFVSEKYLKEKWGAEIGIRYDVQLLSIATFDENRQLVKPDFNFSYMSLASGFHYLLKPNLTFSLHYGFGQRPPHVSELFSQGLHHGTASIEYGILRPNGILLDNLERTPISKEKSSKIISTLEYEGKDLSFQVSGYINYINNYVFLRPVGLQQSIRGAFVSYEYQQSNVKISGLDLTISKDFSESFTYTGKVSLIRAQDRSNDGRVINIPSNRFENKLQYNFQSIGKAKDVFISIGLANVLKQNRQPQIIPISDIINVSTIENVFDFVEAPDAYALFNTEAGFTLPFTDNSLDVIFSIENAFNTVYNDYMNRMRYFTSDVGRNFSIRLKYNFHAHD